MEMLCSEEENYMEFPAWRDSIGGADAIVLIFCVSSGANSSDGV